MSAIPEPPIVHSVKDVEKLLKTHHLHPDSKSQNRKLLVEGIEIVKNRMKFNKLVDSRLNVDDMGGWFSNFVKNKLGGTTRGALVIWELDNKTIILDPISGQISCESPNI